MGETSGNTIVKPTQDDTSMGQSVEGSLRRMLMPTEWIKEMCITACENDVDAICIT